MTRRKVLAHPVVLTEHVFDKIRSIDMALAEFEELLSGGEVIEGARTRAWSAQGARAGYRLEASVARGRDR